MRARPLAAALVAFVAVTPGICAAAMPADESPERVMVRGLEFDLLLSKQKLVPGRVIIQFVNAGEDPHDLRIQRVGETGEFGFEELGPGEFESLDTRLRRKSTYLLWCSLADHRELGMEATLRTKKRRR